MPTKRKSYTRRPYRRKKKKQKRLLPVGGFPKSKLVRLRYVDECTINAPIGGVATHLFSANGLYDPNVTATGHQPGNFDKWMTVYDHYTVLGSKITVTPVDTDNTTASNNAYMGILKSDTTGGSSMQVTEIMEQKLGSYSRVLVGTPNAFGSRPNSVVNYFSASKFFGKSKQVVAGSEELSGDAANNPGEGCYYEVWCGSVNGNDPASHSFLVEIEYIVLLREPEFTQAS